MATFIIFFAPFLVLIAAIVVVFWIAPKDKSIK
ncbi:cytochrome bd oxidase small subunit CydS [Pseudogracilibacillus sp. SE30717A]